jgi:hypothetical protein
MTWKEGLPGLVCGVGNWWVVVPLGEESREGREQTVPSTDSIIRPGYAVILLFRIAYNITIPTQII